MKYVWTRYTPGYLKAILYMLQSSEYNVGEYLSWYNRTDDFRTVMKRRKLDVTPKIKLLAAILVVMTAILIFSGLTLLLLANSVSFIFGVLVLVLIPWIIAYSIILPLWMGTVFIQAPRERQMIARAHQVIAQHPATKIAIAGSYGKTTAKEVLKTVLGENKKVAATPGNMNTPIGICRFVDQLEGDEDILIFEFGEAKVGDVKELSELTQPDLGIITGINEAHLATFKTLDRTVGTIFELYDYLGDKTLYANIESSLVRNCIKDKEGVNQFDHRGTAGWVVSDAKVTVHGTSFSIQKEGKVVWAHTGLLGMHNVGILSVTVSIASSFGLSTSQITAGLKKIQPFEHRMQPIQLHGAWVIDDTYNGNSEGVEAGLKLLGQLDAKRRIYVTPGLVEQGNKTKEVHVKIGRQISEVADVVVLMQNSVTDYIADGLRQVDYSGRLLVVDDPLDFYTHLDQFVAVGDVVLMQNDWTDNYA